MGSLDNKHFVKLYREFNKFWTGELGIHAHDNFKLDLSNSIVVFIIENVSWIDGTILGMGRGPGNAKTENLINSLKKFNKSLLPISPSLLSDFRKLKKKYGWGTNKYYAFSGKTKFTQPMCKSCYPIKIFQSKV